MSVGHGATGVRSNLRRFVDLIDESAADRRPYVRYAPGLAVATAEWALDQGNTYRATVQEIFDGFIRDVVGVEHSGGIGDAVGRLTRVETVEECRATAGTYFYDVDAATVALDTYDEAGLQYDSGLLYDQYPQGTLYVHLHGNANPMESTAIVVPQFGFYFSTRGEIHPELGPNKIASSLAGWTATAFGSYDTGLTYDSGESYDVDYGWSVVVSAGAITIETTGAEAGQSESSLVVATMLAGKLYRVSGEYSTPVGNHANLSTRILLKAGATAILYQDGRTADANGYITLTPTNGQTRRFFADVLLPAYAGDFTVAVQLVGSAGESGSVTFTSVKVQRIYRFNFYEPRLAVDSLPELELAAGSIFFGEQAISMGQLGILNGDGLLEPILGQLLPSRKPVKVSIGGALQDGQEIVADDWRSVFTGHTTDVTCADERVTIAIEDGRTFLKSKLPIRAYSLSSDPEMDSRKAGTPRQYLWGIKAPLAPVRTGITADGFGIFEAIDPRPAVNGIVGIVNGSVSSEVQGEFSPLVPLTNIDLGDAGWTGYGGDNWTDSLDTSGVEAGDGSALASVACTFPDLTSSLPAGAIVQRVRVRFRLGQNALSAFGVPVGTVGVVPVRPYLRYVGGSASFGQLVTITAAAYTWFEQVWAYDPTGAAWTRETVFIKAGNALKLGLRAEPTTSSLGWYTDASEVRILVDYLSPGGDAATAQVLCFMSDEKASKPPVLSEGASLTSPAHYNVGPNAVGHVDSMGEDQVSIDLSLAQITMTRAGKLIEISKDEGSLIHYTTERGTKTVQLPGINVETLYNWAVKATAAFSIADPDVTVTIDSATGKYSVAKSGGGTLTILCKTGDEPARQPWGKMGFDTNANLSGALSYTATRAAYVRDETRDDIDVNPVRAVVHGYKDDATGTYTGVPNAAIELAPDIVRMILARLVGLHSALIDDASFTAARTSQHVAIPLTVHLSKKEEVRTILARIEQTTISTIAIDGDGIVYFRPYTAGVPATIRDFYDRDYLGESWSLGYVLKNAHKGVRVYYGNDHNAGDSFESVERIDPGAAVRHGREEIKEIYTYLRATNDAVSRVNQYFRLGTANPRVASFSAKGKLVDLMVGDKIRLTRSRGLDATGALDAVVFRVQRLRHNYIEGVSHCEAIEDVSFL